jgi:hypothetical protein
MPEPLAPWSFMGDDGDLHTFADMHCTVKILWENQRRLVEAVRALARRG